MYDSTQFSKSGRISSFVSNPLDEPTKGTGPASAWACYTPEYAARLRDQLRDIKVAIAAENAAIIDPVDPPATRVVFDPTTVVMLHVKHTYDCPFVKRGETVIVVTPRRLWGKLATHWYTEIECRGERGIILEVVR